MNSKPSLAAFGAPVRGIEIKQVDPSKLDAARKKSKYQKEKEEQERKQRLADEETAKAYADFVDAFDGPSSSQHGGMRAPMRGFVKAGGSKSNLEDSYNPMALQAAAAAAGNLAQASRRATASSLMEEEEPANLPVRGKKRNMDSFLEELKRNEAVRESKFSNQRTPAVSISAMAAAEARGPQDIPEAASTNIHVQPIPIGTTENDLGMFFARYGPVGSAKIMFPRDEMLTMAGPTSSRRTRTAGLSGFVLMMDRRQAERAIEELDGKSWNGSSLVLGWGKGMPAPSRPMYISNDMIPEKRSRGRSRSKSPRPSGRRAKSPDSRSGRSKRKRSDSRSRSRSRSRTRHGKRSQRTRSRSQSPSRSRSRSRSRTPRNWPEMPSRKDEDFLEDFAKKIDRYGHKYEQEIRQREAGNPKYQFLSDQSLPAYHYFRMLMDRDYTFEPATLFTDDGNYSVHSSGSEELSDCEQKKTQLGKRNRQRLEAMLRSVTAARDKIGRCMAFAMERAEVAGDVAELITQSLLLPATPIPRKMARLYVVSDILANSSSPLPSAWKYRAAFETRLNAVFDHLNQIYQTFPGRMRAEAFKKQIMSVVNLWETMLIFTPAVIENYSNRLGSGGLNTNQQEEDAVGQPVPVKAVAPVPKKIGFKAINTKVNAPVEEDCDGAPIPNESIDGDELDGENINDSEDMDLDGEEMDVDGAAIGPESKTPGLS